MGLYSGESHHLDRVSERNIQWGRGNQNGPNPGLVSLGPEHQRSFDTHLKELQEQTNIARESLTCRICSLGLIPKATPNFLTCLDTGNPKQSFLWASCSESQRGSERVWFLWQDVPERFFKSNYKWVSRVFWNSQGEDAFFRRLFIWLLHNSAD